MHLDPAHWLSALPDNLPISEINIPGSHNAAAINTKRRTRWTCQDHSITEQLNRGIRLLDIRLKPKKFHFVTCHGHLGPFGVNEFQSLNSALEECTTFLKINPTETIIITVQIDDWRNTPKHKHPEILQALQVQLEQTKPIHPPHIPTLGQCRGRIFLINRINDNPELGVPIKIPDNTPGIKLTSTKDRQYEVYVQDQYKSLNKSDPETHKLNLVTNALEHKRPGNILLNFASATKPFGRLIYIQKALSKYLNQPHPLGWFLLDYPFQHQDKPGIITVIIASNNH